MRTYVMQTTVLIFVDKNVRSLYNLKYEHTFCNEVVVLTKRFTGEDIFILCASFVAILFIYTVFLFTGNDDFHDERVKGDEIAIEMLEQ